MGQKQAQADALRVYGLDHAAYRCRDAEETRAFYEDICGFPLTLALHIDRHPTTGEDVNYLHIFFEMSSEKPDVPEHLAFFEVTDREEDDPEDLFKTRWGMDLHFAMRVADYDALRAWKEKLEANDVDVEGPIDHGIFRSIYFHDPNGYRLEFCASDADAKRMLTEERAMARENMQKWANWKATRNQAAAE